jgi:HAD superfamily hydrolase (TIGR01509 family)
VRRTCKAFRGAAGGIYTVIFPAERFDGVIFDLDGTLVNSSHVWSDIDVKFLAKRGFEVPDDYFKKISCLNFAEGALYTIERFSLDEKPEDIVKEWFDMAKFEYAHNIRTKPHAARFLEHLKSHGIKIALATASNPELYTAVLKNNGIYDLFDAFASTEEVCRSKEFPDVYILAAGKLGCKVCRCAVFEDIFEGAQSAKAGGFYVCACLDEYYACDREKIIAVSDLSFADYGEILGDSTCLAVN